MAKKTDPPSGKGKSDAYRTPQTRFIISSASGLLAPAEELKPGDAISKRYVVESTVGVGGMCTVYLVSDRAEPGRKVALKMIAAEGNPVRMETFRNEFRILAHLEHENLLRVFDFGVLPDTSAFFYTAEYIDGIDFREAVATAPQDTLVRYIVRICRALEYVHSRGYIHYDVKPSNILVAGDGTVKLTDFGLSALSGRGLGKRVRGTPAYTSPEIITGADIDSRADLYSLGVSLYEAVTGTIPFRKSDLHDLFRAHVVEQPKPPLEVNGDAPEYLEPVIMRLLAKNPADRFQTANAVIEAIARARGEEIELQPPGSVEGYVRNPPLCGREKEMKFVSEALDALGEGKAGFIVIHGQTGIGRSRLLREAFFEAQLRGFAAAKGNAEDADVFEKLASGLIAHPEVEPAAKPGKREPAESIAEPAPGLPEPVAGIIATAEDTPTVICIDDLQAAPPKTLAAVSSLEKVLSTGGAPKLLLIASWRDAEEAEPPFRDSANLLRLEPLRREIVDEVVMRMFGSIRAPELFITRLMDATAGLPLAVVETVRMLVASGEIGIVEGKWRFRGGVEPFNIAPTLGQFYAERVEALSPDEHKTALNIALIGRPVSVTEISVIHDEPPDRIAAALAALERKGILTRKNGRLSVAGLGILEGLLSSRSQLTLRRRHELIASRLETIKDRLPGFLELARHFLLAGRTRKGLRYGIEAIKAGEADKDPSSALPVLERLRAASAESSRANRAAILFALANARDRETDPKGALQIIAEYRASAPRSEPAPRRAVIERYAAECHGRLNEQEAADKAWQRALELVEPGSPEHLRMLVAYETVMEYRGRFAECESLLSEATAKYGGGKNYETVALWGSFARLTMRMGKSAQMKSHVAKAQQAAKEAGIGEDPRLVNLLGITHASEGNFSEAAETYEHGREIAIEKNDFRTLASIDNNLTYSYFRLGKIDEALRTAAEAESIFRRYANFQSLAQIMGVLGRETHQRLGTGPAIGYMEKALEYARASGSALLEHHVLNTLGDISCLRGNFDAAIKYSDASLAIGEKRLPMPPIAPMLIRASASALKGNLPGALEYAQKAIEATKNISDVDTRVDVHARACHIAMLAGDTALALTQLTEIEKLPYASNALHRFHVRMVEAGLWNMLGVPGRAAEIVERLASDSDAIAAELFRAMLAVMSGRLSVQRYRFADAENSFQTARNILNPDTNIESFIDLLSAEVELELARRDTDCAAARLEKLEETIAELPGESSYYRLSVGLLRARQSLLSGDGEAAYRESMARLLESGGGGYRFFELRFSKIAASTTRDAGESDNLSKKADEIAEAISAPLPEDVRETVRTFLLSPPQEATPTPLEASGESADRDASGALLQLAVFLAREDDPQRATEAIIDVAFRTLDAGRAFLVVKGEEGLKFSGSRYASGAVPDDPKREVSKSVVDRVIETGKTVTSESARDDTILGLSKSVMDMELRSILAVPVRVGGKVEGCLYLDNAGKPAAFTAEDSRRAQYLASLAGAVLDRQLLFSRMKEQSESLRYRFERQSAEFEIVKQELEETRREHATEELVGNSAPVREMKNTIKLAAGADLPVLVTGESGTGKDLVAKMLHTLGRRTGDFVTVNCGAIPETLFAAELFGVERGAFTGAEESKGGLFEAAEGGTIFFDEISDLPQSSQNAILRAVEEGAVRRVGGREPVPFSARIISATNRDIDSLIDSGDFRSDLHYRLNALEIHVPPLRAREGDVSLLAAHFLDKIASSHGGKVKPLSLEAMDVLESHPWPGNVRELRNALERAYTVSEDVIGPEHLKLETRPLRGPELRTLAEIERAHILRALEKFDGNQSRAARALGVSRETLRRKLKQYADKS
ncbi:MAG: sigma 54-interacting transcriptional regulator [Planctomycetota bacterium]|jgi:transcriptional regulator with GAF, ATPase, and Fis domain